MCDYSLKHMRSRSAKVGDRLVTTDFNGGTRGFSSIGDPNTAVCVLPGTQLAFADDIKYKHPLSESINTLGCNVVSFSQIDKDLENVHHDVIVPPAGEPVLLTHLVEGQEAEVLQLPAPPLNEAQVQEQRRAEYV